MNENFVVDRLDNAVEREEYKQMQNLLKPIELDRERQKDKYASGAQQQQDLIRYPLMQDTGKLLFSQSSGFNTFDKHFASTQVPLRIDQMITLSVYNSQSGTIKKMLHGPSLKIFCVKEVPLANRESRRILKEWLQIWQDL